MAKTGQHINELTRAAPGDNLSWLIQLNHDDIA